MFKNQTLPLRILFIVSTFFLLLFTFSCKKKSAIDPKNLGWSGENYEKYISESSPLQIGVKENIIIRLAITPDKIKSVVGESIEKGLSISPVTKGQFIWKDETTIAFVAEDRLENNTAYKIDVELDAFYNKVDQKSKTLSLTLSTKKQNLSLQDDGIGYETASDGSETLTLNGSIHSADYAINADIEKTIIVSQQKNANVTIEWNHLTDREHAFTINGIKRLNEDADLKITYDGKNIDDDFKGERIIPIIKKGVFAHIDTKVTNEGSKRVDLIFSDPVQTPQNLQGLITVNDKTIDLNYEIEGNKVRLYFDNLTEQDIVLTVDGNIKNKDGKALGNTIKTSISFKAALPEVKMLRKGVVIPETDKIWLPFQARNLKFVDIIITKIYQNNVLQFLQNNNFDDYYNLLPVGKEINKEKVNLEDIAQESNRDKFQKYTLDISRMVNLDKGAIYYVEISFTKDYIDKYPCAPSKSNDNGNDEEQGDGDYYDGDDYSGENPCNSYYYYGNKFANTLIHASNIGLIAKGQPDNTLHLVCAEISSAEPISGAQVEVYDFQKQLLSKGSTDSKGMARIMNKERAAFVIVKYKDEYGYLNIQDNYANATSEFDVAGKLLQTGLDAFIYGERGVYRPGDSMHINVMLYNHSKDGKAALTDNYPVRLIAEDSRGKVMYDKVNTSNTNHIYYFPIVTRSNANTGNWKLTAQLGNEKFYKTIKVETVKPNRLKIVYTNEKTALKLFDNPTLSFESKWLHGASAEGLKAEVDLTLNEREVTFNGYKSYTFSDPARNVEYASKRVYDGSLDDSGKASYKIEDDANLLPASGIKAVLKTRVYEKSGNYSEDYASFDADKYSSYVGLKLPQSDWGGHYFKSGVNQSFPVVVLNTQGKPIPNRKLTVGLYQAEWDWWYNESNYAILKYNSDMHVGALKTFNLTTNAKGEAAFSQTFDDYGNFMVRICDTESGHCTGDFFYTSRWGNPPSNNGAAQLLTVTTDKENYNVGDEIKLRIPSNANSKILISLEKGSDIDQIFKIQGKEKETIVSIPVTKEMSPNIYLNVSLIQPYSTNTSGLPLRMYGIANVKIVDPSKTLVPVIAAPKVIAPNEFFNIAISEKSGKDMAYTLAIVDEGLLDLTRFKTPDPINHFFAKQSLGINTWDMYDKVMNPYGQEIENLFSIGGDADNTNLNSVKKANRFIPTVKHLGPFTLKAGSKNNHQINISNYIGSVRIMVVAKNDECFGNAEQTCPVKKDLMVQNTLPRVLTPGDEISLGANVFAMNNTIKNVNLGLTHDNYFTSLGGKSAVMNFSKEGDQLFNFPVKVSNAVGIGKIGTNVNSGKLSSKEDTEIEIRNPNPVRSEIKDVVIEAGKSADVAFLLFGSRGTNSAELEISNAPLLNLGRRLDYLIQYPYGCIEQTTSSAFPQLYIADVTELSPLKKQTIANNITRAIQRIAGFQVSNGGFAYWPGNTQAEDWASSYAGHFLIEAKAKANYVPETVLKKWADYQKGKANSFNGTYDYSYHAQAYRLYTLAKYGKPELGAMNRLRNQKNIDIATIRTLAAAYATIGKKDIANSLMTIQKVELAYAYNHDYESYTYGSDLRNKAMYAEAYYEMGNEASALSTIKSIASDLSSNRWYNTQAVSYALMVIQKFYKGGDKAGLSGNISYNAKKMAISSTKKIALQELALDQSKTNQSVRISNTTKGKMYIRLTYSGKDEVSKGIAAVNNMHIGVNVRYTDAQGKAIDIRNLRQGTSIIAKIDVSNLGSFYGKIENIALNFVVPAGWEINNERLAGIDRTTNGIEYQDIRDDRVTSFFDLYSSKTLSVQIPLTAAYAGKFYFPPVSCEAMYNNEVFAMTGSQHVTVLASTGNKNEQ